MEKTISLETYGKIKAGDYIQIVSERPASVRFGWASMMAGLLSQTCQVCSISQEAGKTSAVAVKDKKGYTWLIPENMIIKVTKAKHEKEEDKMMNKSNFIYAINKVIYNNPATIVLWADGTKTTAKVVENETYDPEKGLLLCALKKLSGTDEVMNLLRFAELADKGTVTHQDVRNLKKKELRKSKKLSKNS